MNMRERSLIPKISEPYPVDVVYTWVDSNDSQWQKEFSGSRGAFLNNYAAHPCRFRDNGELQYSLLSLERFAPWVNCIYIVKKSYQTPAINHLSAITQSKIVWIDERSLCPPSLNSADVYPIFNSLAIEANLHRIPNLAEHFIYFNNDMFLGARISPDYFFPNNTIRLAIKKNIMLNNRLFLPLINPFSTKHLRHLFNAFRLLSAELGSLNSAGFPYCKIPVHQCTPILKSSYEWSWQQPLIRQQLLLTSATQFRAATNIHAVFLSSLVSLCQGRALIVSEKDVKIYLHKNKLAGKLAALKKSPPPRFCLNDSVSNSNNSDAVNIVSTFLHDFFKDNLLDEDDLSINNND